jgi:hypothetical protein
VKIRGGGGRCVTVLKGGLVSYGGVGYFQAAFYVLELSVHI